MICRECVWYDGRVCLWSNRQRFWFDGYNCKHANNGTNENLTAEEYARMTQIFALKVLSNFLKRFCI